MSIIRIFNAAVEQYEKSQANLQKISDAKIKAERDSETFDITNNLAKEKLKLLKAQNKITENDFRIQEASIKEQQKSVKKINDGIYEQITQAEDTNYKSLQGAVKSLNLLGNDPRTAPEFHSFLQDRESTLLGYGKEQAQSDVETPNFGAIKQESPKMEVARGRGGHLYYKPAKAVKPVKPEVVKIDPVEKAIGLIQTSDYDTRKEYENKASAELGVNWKAKFPEVNKIIDSKAGPDPKEFNAQIKTFKTKDDAIRFLTKNYGMSLESAIKYLKTEQAQ